MPKFKDETGRRFGNLTVQEFVGFDKFRRALWKCKCDCGNIVNVAGQPLRSGNTRSCGCYAASNSFRLRGNKHPSWKGGRSITERGYVAITASESRSRYEHQLVMEQYLGRPLEKGESVHHKNGIRHDNRIENLELWHRGQPAGQRVDDKIQWCLAFLDKYAPQFLSPHALPGVTADTESNEPTLM